MNAPPRCIHQGFPRAALSVGVLMALPFAGLAQSVDHASMSGMTTPAVSATVATPSDSAKHQTVTKPGTPRKPASHASDMGQGAMDHGGLPGMHTESTPAMNKPASADTGAAQPANVPSIPHVAMPRVDHAGMDHAPMPDMTPSESPAPDPMSGMNMGAMQGGSAPPGARSPDYSGGMGYGPMESHLHGNDAVGMLLLNQLETVHGRDGNAQVWEVEGWYGRDENKLWLRSEGEASQGRVEDGNVEVLWSHAITACWGSQLGVRHDFGAGPGRDWVAFGVQGLAPYWFELEATGYVGSSGRTAARFRGDYEVLFTQRLVLQPELELNLYGKNDSARGIGSGLSDVQFGLRLRYEVRREFAPYVGINWVRRVGTSADYARADGQPVLDQQFVAGFRIWF